MLLENKYYQIKEMKMNQQEGIFRLRLLPDVIFTAAIFRVIRCVRVFAILRR